MVKIYSIKDDPYAAREASRYAEPIPSREYIMQFLRERGKPAKNKQILQAFQITNPEQIEAIKRRLCVMELDGQIIRNRRSAYGLVQKMDLIPGRVVGHRDGYGFLVADDGGTDLYLSPRQMRKVLHGDRVLAQISSIDARGRREAEIVEVLEQKTRKIVGKLNCEDGLNIVIPDNKKITQVIMIKPDAIGEAKNGQIVVVELLRETLHRGTLMGQIIEILGEKLTPSLEIQMAIHSHGLPHSWPDAVLTELKGIPEEVLPADKEGRVDCRDLAFVTIDGEDAKDFDDAVFASPHAKGGFRLCVAIADVSHYVKIGSALDQEACNRGTSIYFPGSVIPMLPPLLSNQLCSLMPRVDRLSLVADMVISASGELESFTFYDAVIHSHARLTYNQVAKMLIDQDPILCKQHADVLPHLQNLHQLYACLREKRDERGAIDFDTIETRFELDSHGKVKKIVPLIRNDAHKLIEECMILANVAAAKFLQDRKIPILYRIHEPPPLDKLNELRNFLSEFHLGLSNRKHPHPGDFGAILSKLKDKPYSHLVQTVLLRSLSQAVYSPKEVAHFGLALPIYTHFTSPIRRYPDLLVHRAIRYLCQHKNLDRYYYDSNKMLVLGQECSSLERRADDAARDVESRLKCEYMLDKIGQEYDGIITNVAGFGLFVELNELYVEGLVHVTALPNDYYHFHPQKHRLTGERTNSCYRLGDQIRVRLVAVDPEAKTIELELADFVQKTKKKSKGIQQ